MTESRKPLHDGAPGSVANGAASAAANAAAADAVAAYSDGKPAAAVGHVHAREQAIAMLGADISAATIETIRRMHVSGEPGVEGWIGIAKQVEAIARQPSRDGLRSLRETVKEGK